jgi:hypothetical protein
MSTPVPQDLFSRYLVGTYDEKKIIGVSTGFQSFFGRPVTGAETIYAPDANQVDIEIIRGNERLAALIPRGGISRSIGSTQKNVRSEQFSSFSRKYPLCEEEGDITADNLLNRVAGENPYARQTRMDRLRYHAVKIHHESMRRMIRLHEVLAAQSILTGKMDAILSTTNTDLQYDFRRNTTHNITVGASWSGGAADILGDIDSACAKIRANGKVIPDCMLIGSTALNSMISDTTVKSLADNRRFEFIQFGGPSGAGVGDDMFVKGGYSAKFAHLVAGGFIARGLLRTPSGFELMMFTYLDVYTNEAGVPTKYLPDDKVVICSCNARCDRYFGPPETLPNVPTRDILYREYFGFDPSQPPMPPKIRAAGGVIVPQAFCCDAYVSGDNKRITIRCQCAPIFATTQTDAFVTLDTEI